MCSERYWVIGGEYHGMEFTRLRENATVEGPFESREEANAAWKRLSAATSSQATTRFSITAEQIRIAG